GDQRSPGGLDAGRVRAPLARQHGDRLRGRARRHAPDRPLAHGGRAGPVSAAGRGRAPVQRPGARRRPGRPGAAGAAVGQGAGEPERDVGRARVHPRRARGGGVRPAESGVPGAGPPAGADPGHVRAGAGGDERSRRARRPLGRGRRRGRRAAVARGAGRVHRVRRVPRLADPGPRMGAGRRPPGALGHGPGHRDPPRPAVDRRRAARPAGARVGGRPGGPPPHLSLHRGAAARARGREPPRAGRDLARRRRADRRGEVHPAPAARPAVGPAAGHGVRRRPRDPRDPARGSPPRDRVRAAGAVPVLAEPARERAPRRSGRRARRRGRRREPHRGPGAAPGRVGDGRGRARADPLGGAAPAGDAGARAAAGAPNPAARRRAGRGRRGDGGGDPRPAAGPDPRADGARRHPPAPGRGGHGPDGRAGRRARGGGGDARGPPGAGRSLRPPLAAAAARAGAGRRMRGLEPDDEQTTGRVYDARLARRVWAYTRPYRQGVALATGLFVPLAALDVAQPYLVKLAIDRHILRSDWAGLSRVGLLFLATLVAQYGLRYAQVYVATWTGQRVVHDLRAALFAHVQQLPAAFFDRNPVGRVMTRVLGDVEAIGEVFAAGVVAIVGDALTLAGVIAIMLWLHARLALVTFAVMPLVAVVGGGFRGPIRRAYRTMRARLARLSVDLQESIAGMSVVQLFGLEAARAGEFAARNEEYRRAQFHRIGLDSALYAAIEAAGAIVVAVLLWRGGLEILGGTLTF